ncbi:hypothetical protein CN203_11480 [Sinorhizobium meliloti]|uniref:endonuclease domain-containing protein n=1 Tax=Rhizobium meliloti TaxID=382 RepID=UPI0002E351AE|nr:hypothetical protein [Sinorhizobium meliloti]RVH78110.1 hypothetical protein CN203_11480 [Sinorhizobium meliloti]
MIKNRPAALEARPEYGKLPTKPFALSWDWVPELVNASLMPLSGVQPVTGKMCELVNGVLRDEPTDAEVEYFRSLGATFQPILLVMNLAAIFDAGEAFEGIPYAISAIPMSKRGIVTTVNIDSVKAHRGGVAFAEADWAYSGFDPFLGEWTAFSTAGTILQMKGGNGYVDELGAVVGMYYLWTGFDHEDVLEVDQWLPDATSRKRFLRNRIKTVYQPFKRVETRRIWGAQSPIELFLYQELLFRGLRPTLQQLVFPDGRTYPSLYDSHADIETRHELHLLTEIDIYFPGERLAIFCDGAHHGRGKQADRDAKIDGTLAEFGITSIRVSGKMIMENLPAAADNICEKIEQLRKGNLLSDDLAPLT